MEWCTALRIILTQTILCDKTKTVPCAKNAIVCIFKRRKRDTIYLHLLICEIPSAQKSIFKVHLLVLK